MPLRHERQLTEAVLDMRAAQVRRSFAAEAEAARAAKIADAAAYRAETRSRKEHRLMTGQLTEAEYLALSRAERRQARREGRTNDILGAPAAPEGDGPLTHEQYARLTQDDRRRAREAGRVDHLLNPNTDGDK